MLEGGSHRVYSFNPATMNNGTEVAPSQEESFTRGGVFIRKRLNAVTSQLNNQYTYMRILTM